MARRRMIDPSIWDDEGVGSLSDMSFRLFIACLSYADDEGRLEGTPKNLKAIAFRFKQKSLKHVQSALTEIDTNIRGFHRYSVDGRAYIALLNWSRYQRVDKPQPSKIPPPGEVPFQDDSTNGIGTIQERSRPRARSLKVEGEGEGEEKIIMPPSETGGPDASGCPYCRKPSSNPDLQLWHDLYLEVKGMCPTIRPGKDGATLKALRSAGRTVDELTSGIRAYLQHPDPWIIQQGHALDILGKRFDAYRNGVPLPIKQSTRGERTPSF